jgi:hypothetical protein
MIDHAYNKVLKEWVGALTEQEKASLDLMRLIAEAEVPWRTAQITVLTSLIENSVIARWAKDTIQGWDAASISGKTSKLFIALDKIGILEKGRDIFMGKGPSRWSSVNSSSRQFWRTSTSGKSSRSHDQEETRSSRSADHGVRELLDQGRSSTNH